MSPVAAACVAVPPAMATGCTIGVLVDAWWQHKRSGTTESSPDVLADDDRDATEAEFSAHAAAVAAQVTEYADALAGGDPVLRARLRKLERHVAGRR